MLQRLADACSIALEWSSDSEATTADAAEAFESLLGICRHAGLVVANSEELSAGGADSEIGSEPGLTIEISCSGFSDSGVSRRDPGSARSYAPEKSEAWSPCHFDSLSSPTEPTPHRNDEECPASPMQREEIIEIELTDLLTHTHEEIEHCRRELTEQLHQADRRHVEAQAQSQRDLQLLHSAFERSQETMIRIQQEMLGTKLSMAALQSSVLQSQKTMEAAMKNQAQQWKAICNDLIVEKRNVAKKLAEERGKCAALKEHLAMHDNQRHARKSQPSPHHRRNGYDRATSTSPRSLSELEPEDNSVASPLCPAIQLQLAAMKKSSIDSDFELLSGDSYNEGVEDLSSALRPPSSPSLSRAESPSAVHSPTRKLKPSDLSTSPTSNSGHRSCYSVVSSSRSRSGISSSSLSAVKLRLESLSGRTSGTTASFRRYYLSSQQLSAASSNSRSNSNATGSSSQPPPSADGQ